jgi:carboxyl-terminal processing protease
MRKRSFWITLLLSFFFSLSSLWWSPTANAFTEEQKLVLQAWRIVNQSYLDETFNHQNWWMMREKYLKRSISNDEEAYDTITEMLGTLGDPFTRLLKPEQYRSLKVNTSGELSGVGLQININPENKYLEVVTPMTGSPAEKAGIKPRDRIIEIDGILTNQISLDEAASLMRGQIGTTVTLTVQAPKENAPLKRVELVRDRISLNPVYARLDHKGDQSIGYLRLAQFSANATEEISKAVKTLDQQGAKSYILDLRNNPGGLLQAGIEIARLFMDQGTIVYTVNRQGMLGSFETAENAITQAPLVVLVNQGTASASEILAGALQDNGRALLVGEKTFGKGLIQSLFDLPNGAGLAITVAKYETPSHKDINKLGILPDNVIDQDPISLEQVGTENDLQYQKAANLLNSQTVVGKRELEFSRS